MARKPLTKGQRFEIFKRDEFTCQYCGATPPRAILHVDHIIPVKLGGGNGPDNLVTACSECNLGKSATPLEMAPKSLAEKAALVAEREAQIAGYAEVLAAERERIEQDAWRVAEELKPGASEGYSRDKFTGIKNFVVQLGVYSVLDAADIANSRRQRGSTQAFKYFCGICWNRIREGAE